jgi:hypothetical protein
MQRNHVISSYPRIDASPSAVPLTQRQPNSAVSFRALQHRRICCLSKSISTTLVGCTYLYRE